MRVGPHTYVMNFADKFDEFAQGKRCAFHLIVGIDDPVRLHDRIVATSTTVGREGITFRVTTVEEMNLQDMPDADLPLFGRSKGDLVAYQTAWDKWHPKTPWASNPRVWKVVVRLEAS